MSTKYNGLKKYDLTEETISHCGKTLHRIQALRSFGNVTAGDLGGFVEDESNLSHDGNAWVFDNAKVFSGALVYGDAVVRGATKVYGNAKVYDDANVCGDIELGGLWPNFDWKISSVEPVPSSCILLYEENSDCKCGADIEVFADFDTAQQHMENLYKKTVAALCFDANKEDDDHHSSCERSSASIQDGMDFYRWSIRTYELGTQGWRENV